MNTNPAESYIITLMTLVPGVAHSIVPNALIDWKTMEISYKGGSDERFVPFATHSKKFSSLLELTNFVDQNKDRIVIHDAFLPPKIDDPDFAPVQRGVMLKYAKNPDMDYFISKEEVAQANYESLRDFHDACIKELYRQLGIDGEDGEYRFKWVSLEVHRLVDENKKLKEQLAKYTAEPEQEPPIPSNLDEALSQLESNLTDEDRAAIRANDSAVFHFGPGMALRNRWKLWEESPLSKWFNGIGIFHADDMSGIILTALKHRVMGTPYNMDADVKFYQDYWAKKAAKD
jgi:hypothetical protein